jgi:hypothetical protein
MYDMNYAVEPNQRWISQAVDEVWNDSRTAMMPGTI